MSAVELNEGWLRGGSRNRAGERANEIRVANNEIAACDLDRVGNLVRQAAAVNDPCRAVDRSLNGHEIVRHTVADSAEVLKRNAVLQAISKNAIDCPS